MAITKDKKQALVSELSELFAGAKGTAVAKYQGLSVADVQDLRKSARAAGVSIKVVKTALCVLPWATTKPTKLLIPARLLVSCSTHLAPTTK